MGAWSSGLIAGQRPAVHHDRPADAERGPHTGRRRRDTLHAGAAARAVSGDDEEAALGEVACRRQLLELDVLEKCCVGLLGVVLPDHDLMVYGGAAVAVVAPGSGNSDAPRAGVQFEAAREVPGVHALAAHKALGPGIQGEHIGDDRAGAATAHAGGQLSPARPAGEQQEVEVGGLW